MFKLKIAATPSVWVPSRVGLGALLLAGCTVLLVAGLTSVAGGSGLQQRLVTCAVQPGPLALSGQQNGSQPAPLALSELQNRSAQQQELLLQLLRQQKLGVQAEVTPEQLVCGGPGAIPSVESSLAASTEAMLRGPEDDLRPYEGGFTLEDIKATAEAVEADGQAWDVRAWVEVRDKRIVFPRRPNMVCAKPDQGCNHMIDVIVESLERGMAAGKLSLPESIPMLWNVQDHSKCGPLPKDGSRGHCRAPLFSLFKRDTHTDVMVPPMRPRFEPQFVPWDEKIDLAFFRGAPICSFVPLNATRVVEGVNCSRWRVAELSQSHPDLINATLTVNVTQYGGPPFVPGRDTTHEEHAHYKWLLNVDGSTAAHRLTTLLSMNSLALKQASPDVAWYYRAVKPCVHYVNFWVTAEDDLLQLIPLLRLPANQAMAQRIAANGQAFALQHFTDEAMWKYWELLMQRYVKLYRGNGTQGGAQQ